MALGAGNAAASAAGGAFALNPQNPVPEIDNLPQQHALHLAAELGRHDREWDDGILVNPPAEDIDGHPEGYPDQRGEMPEGPAGFPVMNGDELGPSRLETPVEQPGRQNPLIFTPFPTFNLYLYYFSRRADNISRTGNSGNKLNSIPNWQKNLYDPNLDRHMLQNIKQGTHAKPWNSVIEPWVDVNEDCHLIREGYAKIEGDTFVINDRRYGHHEVKGANGARGLYPIEGPGIYKLSQSEFKAFKLFNDSKVAPRAESIAKLSPDITGEDIEMAKSLVKKFKKSYPEVYNGI